MQIGVAEVFLGLAIALYIFMLIDRVCKCIEACANHKALAGMYAKMDPILFQQVSNKIKET